MKVVALEGSLSEGEFVEIINVDFDGELLAVTVLIDGDKLDITFDTPAGFRVLDEGDLLEYWPDCSTTNGWLYEIAGQGWLDQERQRGGFLSGHNPEIKEYFIAGVNYCISVLAWEKPDVEASTR